jgi:hypothetical protein
MCYYGNALLAYRRVVEVPYLQNCVEFMDNKRRIWKAGSFSYSLTLFRLGC